MNHLKALRRREAHLAESEVSPETPEEALLRQERAERLKAVLDSLSDRERQLFYRRYYYLQPLSQIAAETGMSERSAEGRLYRLRQRLRQEWGGDEPGGHGLNLTGSWSTLSQSCLPLRIPSGP